LVIRTYTKVDAALLARLPQSVCPCAENGEFHTFAVDGPAFSHPVAVTPLPAFPSEKHLALGCRGGHRARLELSRRSVNQEISPDRLAIWSDPTGVCFRFVRPLAYLPHPSQHLMRMCPSDANI
jgi:hypothetical protein